MNRTNTRSQSRRSSQRGFSSWLLPAGVLVIAAALITAIFFIGGVGEEDAAVPSQDTGPTAVQEPAGVDLTQIEDRDESDALALGPVDADVVMIVMSDFQCPYCAQWHDETLPQMMQYVEDGSLRIEFRGATVFGPASERAARAEYAAAMQGRLYDFQTALFPDGTTLSEGQLSDGGLVEVAAEIGLDTEQFEQDYTSESTLAQVAAHKEFTASLGVYSTPAFIVGGEPILGAQPSQVFLEAFDRALAAAE
ncbi:DsbA family protein [Agrococcus casei]|uniref:DsbA family protein n=1 Tax=Agrococcus casei TaxID=343512 RepID=UPI000B35994A|nr:thioredoxin domain-containing protein [Agrococcus casei]